MDGVPPVGFASAEASRNTARMSTTVMHVDMRVGQTIQIGAVRLTLANKSGRQARLSVVAPRDVPINLPRQSLEAAPLKNIPTSAQECAPTPQRGSKEQAHGQHPV